MAVAVGDLHRVIERARSLGLRSTLGRRLPHALRVYGFGARLGGAQILAEIRRLARQSGIPARHLTLIDRHASAPTTIRRAPIPATSSSRTW
jgi:hypothetical protein